MWLSLAAFLTSFRRVNVAESSVVFSLWLCVFFSCVGGLFGIWSSPPPLTNPHPRWRLREMAALFDFNWYYVLVISNVAFSKFGNLTSVTLLFQPHVSLVYWVILAVQMIQICRVPLYMATVDHLLVECRKSGRDFELKNATLFWDIVCVPQWVSEGQMAAAHRLVERGSPVLSAVTSLPRPVCVTVPPVFTTMEY